MRSKRIRLVVCTFLVSIAITAAEISGGKSRAGILAHLKGLLRSSNKWYKSHLSRVSKETKGVLNLTGEKRQNEEAEKPASKQEENLEIKTEPGSDYPTEPTSIITEPVIESIVVDIEANICECVITNEPGPITEPTPITTECPEPITPSLVPPVTEPVIADIVNIVVPPIVDIVDTAIIPVIAIVETVENEIISLVAPNPSNPSDTTSVSYPTTPAVNNIAIPPWAAVAFFGAAAAIAVALGVAIPAAIEPVAAPIDSIVMGRFSCRQTPENKNVKIPFDGCGNSSVRFDDGHCGSLLKRGPCTSPYHWVTVDPTTFKV